MYDQANQLRQLVLSESAQGLAPSMPAPPMVVVAGGKGGVGATTVAVNLAVSLARQGWRTVLVDANLQQPDAAAMCCLDDKGTLADVLAGNRTVHEVLQRGPAGVQVLPGDWAPARAADCSPRAQNRLLAELARLGPHADAIILDAGSGMGPVVQCFAAAGDLLLMITTDEAVSIMDTYAAIKILHGTGCTTPIQTVANKQESRARIEETHARIAQACRRFLGIETRAAGGVPQETAFAASGQNGPLVLESSNAASRAIESLGANVIDFFSGVAGQPALGRRLAA